MKRAIIWLVVAAMALPMLLSGCAQRNAQTDTTGYTEPSEVQSTAADLQLVTDPGVTITPGMVLSLTADQLPADADVVWTSSDEQKATVDNEGCVTPIATRGTVTVTATAGDDTQSWTLQLGEQTSYGVVSLPTSDKELTIGVWVGSFHWFDEQYIKLMADAGINLLVGVLDKWVGADGTLMLDQAQAYGVSIISDLRGWDGVTVPEYADHPALAGFLIYDEPGADKFDELASIKAAFEQVMPEDKMFYVNLFPEACSYESLYGESYDKLWPDYENLYLKAFVDTVDPACISYDAYALQEGDLIRTSYYHNFDVAANLAKEKDIPFWYTLLSAGHSTTDGRYITPTDKELRWQMALGMCYGSDTLNHYILTSRDSEDYEAILEYVSYEPTPVYDDVQQVNLEYIAWQDIFMSYDWLGTASVDVGEINELLSSLEYALSFEQTGILTGVKTNADLLIGVYECEGQNAYMVVNAGNTADCDQWQRNSFAMESAQLQLQFAEGDYRCAAVIRNGQITYIPVGENNTAELTVDAYGSAFVIPVV